MILWVFHMLSLAGQMALVCLLYPPKSFTTVDEFVGHLHAELSA